MGTAEKNIANAPNNISLTAPCHISLMKNNVKWVFRTELWKCKSQNDDKSLQVAAGQKHHIYNISRKKK